MFSGRYFQSILNLNLKLEELELPPPNIFSLNSTGRLFSAASEGYDNSDCCPPVVDPFTLLALLAGIALAAYFLRLALVAKLARRRRRDVGLNDVTGYVNTGRLDTPWGFPQLISFAGLTLQIHRNNSTNVKNKHFCIEPLHRKHNFISIINLKSN